MTAPTLTPYQQAILMILGAEPQPRDVLNMLAGRTNGANQTEQLHALCALGLAEACPAQTRRGYRFRSTRAGEELANHLFDHAPRRRVS